MQARAQSVAKSQSLPRIQSLPKEARTAEAQLGPIYRSCSDTKAEPDKWQSPCIRGSPESIGRCIKVSAPGSIHMPAEGHEPGSVPKYSSGKQAGRPIHETKSQARSVPHKATILEGTAGEACHYVPSKACTQDQWLKGSPSKQAARAVNMAKPQPGSIPEQQATRSEGKAEVTRKYVPGFKSSSGNQAGRAEQKAALQPRSEFKATRCEPDRVARFEGKAELACEATSDLAEAAHWQMLGAQLAPGTYSFYNTEASAVVEDSSLCVIGTDHLYICTSLVLPLQPEPLHLDSIHCLHRGARSCYGTPLNVLHTSAEQQVTCTKSKI